MRRFSILFSLLLLTALVFAEGAKKVAILEVVDKEGKLNYSQKLMLRSNLARAVTNTAGFEAYDRTDIDEIFKEHNFQRTGNVSSSEIKKLGEMTGAEYILVSEAAEAEDDKLFVTAKILNVETTRLEITDNILLGSSSAAMQRGCRSLASKMFGALAGASTSTSKFLSIFTGGKRETMTKEDSIAAAQEAEMAAAAAAAKEQRRLDEQRFRQERAEAQRKAQEERRLANEKNRQEREAAEKAALAKKQQEKAEAEAAEAERAKYYITKISNKEYEYRGTFMDKKAYANFLQTNCPAAFSQYKKGKKLIGAGWGLFATGLALSAGGAACMIIADAVNPYSTLDLTYTDVPETKFMIIGISLLSAGGAMTLVSIPLLGTGYSKRNKAYKVYNQRCSSPDIQPLSLDIKAGPQSLGLALNF